MGNEKEIVFFVLGVDKESKGNYIARVLRTQNGIKTVRFDFASRLLKIKYDSDFTDVNKIKKLTYFGDCTFIDDENEIAKRVELLRLQNKVDKFIRLGGILWIVILAYILLNEMLNRLDGVISYILLLIITLFLACCYLWQKRLEKKEEEI